MLPTTSSLVLSQLVASIHSLQDTLTVTTLQPLIQGTTSYRPTPTQGRVLEGTLLMIQSSINMCAIRTVSQCTYIPLVLSIQLYQLSLLSRETSVSLNSPIEALTSRYTLV